MLNVDCLAFLHLAKRNLMAHDIRRCLFTFRGRIVCCALKVSNVRLNSTFSCFKLSLICWLSHSKHLFAVCCVYSVTSILQPIFVLRSDRKASYFQQPHNKQTFESTRLQFILDSSNVGGMCYSHWDGKWTACFTRCGNVQKGSRINLRGNERISEHHQSMAV